MAIEFTILATGVLIAENRGWSQAFLIGAVTQLVLMRVSAWFTRWRVYKEIEERYELYRQDRINELRP